MEVRISKDEIAVIAAEVVRQLRASGQSVASDSPAKSRAHAAPAASASAAASDATGVHNIESAAEAMQRHPNTIRMHIKAGKLKAKMVKGSYQIKQRDLDKYAASHA
jgi:uncharacterized protein YbjT (DUF2867 family)